MPRPSATSKPEVVEEIDTQAPLVGESLEVPSWVFPRDKLPRGKSGWAATVNGVSKEDPQRIFVQISGSPDEFFFPLEEVQKWIIPREPVSPAHSALQTRSRYSLRSAQKSGHPPRADDDDGATKSPVSMVKRKRGRPASSKAVAVETPKADLGELLSQSAEVVPSDEINPPEPAPESEFEGTSGEEEGVDAKRARKEDATWSATLWSLGKETTAGLASSIVAYAITVALQKEWQT